MKTEKDFEFIIGMNFEEAKALVEKPYFLSPDILNGEPIMKTCDMRTDRINIIVENDIITQINGIH